MILISWNEARNAAYVNQAGVWFYYFDFIA